MKKGGGCAAAQPSLPPVHTGRASTPTA